MKLNNESGDGLKDVGKIGQETKRVDMVNKKQNSKGK